MLIHPPHFLGARKARIEKLVHEATWCSLQQKGRSCRSRSHLAQISPVRSRIHPPLLSCVLEEINSRETGGQFTNTVWMQKPKAT